MKKLNTLLILILVMFPLNVNAQESIRIRAVGDIMLGSAVPDGFLRPEEKGSILQYIRPLLQDADLTVGNLEGTLCDSGTTTKCEPDSLDCYVFRMPEKYGADLKESGFDFLSLANNHAGDFGLECIDRTEYILDSLDIGWSGEPGSFAFREVNGSSVAFIAFHSGGYTNSSLDTSTAKTLIQNLKQDFDLVLVSLHGGAEGSAAMSLPDSMEYYMGEPRGHLRRFAHQMIDAGADLIIGHGPHVARAMEIYRGRLIAYSLANFATYGRFNLLDDRRFGCLLEVELSPKGELLGGRIIATEQKYWGVPLWDRTRRFVHLVDSLSQADLPENGARFTPTGHLILK